MMRPGSGPTRIATPLACAVALLACSPDARVRARSAADGFDELEIDFANPVVGRVPAYLLGFDVGRFEPPDSIY